MGRRRNTRALAAAAPPPAAPAALAAVLDEALDLIARHAPPPSAGAGLPALPAAPLPSLLDRCAALVAAADAEAEPARIVLAADPAAAGTAARLLALVPNLRVIEAAGDGDGADPAAAAGRAADAAARAALWRARGLRMVRILPLAAGAAADPGARRIALLRHPAAVWLDALAAGRAAPSPEAQAAAIARALDALPGDVPVLMREAAEADPAGALAALAAALALPLPGDAAAAADRLAPPAPRTGPPLAWAEGAPATDAPLDGPAYTALCARLGCDPARLGAVDRDAGEAGPALPAGPLSPVPGRPVARLGPTLDRLLLLAAAPPPAPLPPPDAAALVARLEACLADPATAPEAIDAAAAALPPRDAALFLIAAAAHRAATGDRLLALDLLADAEDAMPPDAAARGLPVAAAEVYLALGQPRLALAVLARDALGGPQALPAPLRAALHTAIHGPARTGPGEHGHALLIEHLAAAPPAPGAGPRLMVEIGTTRERVPGQGSTEKLARFCADRGIDFVTVDMDPRNAARAGRLFRRLGLPFRAVAAKGEDWLAAFAGTIDYVFLDAYDFDHGQHSAQRQSRYRAFLGAPIDEAACHRMHRDCAEALVTRLAPDGLICLDDTWTDDQGRWTAKGTTAVPFLLANGFRLIAARNRAALLARG